ncbi:glycosyltransferase [Crocosphaera chwakensis]|uniref:Glycosyl transferase family 1 domain-containing protein n=1 Tax=Crocosphaera chwakensis CCY0110 TaxID=391612 RepID=A3IXP2_9CHRO|nr:glycosyltransferase [Crocosphaera chwakensis]EAZ88743.1 hypothetical protein CY0110_27859 [Crocosphaera chwakensis CCY0110]
MNQDEGKKISPIFVSLIPNLMEGEGHILPYHQAVNKAVNKLGWKHKITVPIDNKVDNLPSEWDECLSHHDLEEKGNIIEKFLRIQGTWKLARSISNYLQNKVINQSELSVVFLERFIHLQLFALYLALLWVPTNKLSVWLLYRRDTHKDKTRLIYKFLNSLIKKQLQPGKFKLLTDSDLLSKSLSAYFEESVIVMPIPHTDINHCNINALDSPHILCWWPGSPREEKGLKIIKSLVNYSGENTKNINLVCAEKTKLQSVDNGIDLKLIDNHLSREQYYHWFGLSQIILLPYSFPAYEGRTSGIFTECIMAGKTPLVTKDTWMAYELNKHNLPELIIDWQDPSQVFETIIKVLKSDMIQDKIKKMQHNYEQFHSVDNYAYIINQVYQEMIMEDHVESLY